MWRWPLLAVVLVSCSDKSSEPAPGGGSEASADDDTGWIPPFEGDDPGECADAADNDLDGLFDCDDPDCALGPDCDTGAPENLAPTQPVVLVRPEVPTPDDDLTCSVTSESVDPEGEAVSYKYDWWVDDEETGISSSVVSARFTGGEESWLCRVTPTDGVNDGLIGRSGVTIDRDNSPPSAPEVEITPTRPGPDDDLTCTVVVESSDVEGDVVTYSYAWAVDGRDLGTSSDVVPGSETEMEQVWTCTVTPSDGRDDGEPGIAEVEIPSCIGQGLELDGTGYAQVGASTDFTWGAALTAEAWVRWDGETGDQHGIIVDHGVSPDYSLTLAVAAATGDHDTCGAVTGGQVLFMVAGHSGTSRTCLKSATALTAGTWAHVATVFDAADMYIFLDGAQDAYGRSGASANDAGSQDLYIGGRPSESLGFYGVVDEIRLSNTVMYSGAFTPETSAVVDVGTMLLFNFDADSGGTASDASGFGHDGILTGGTFTSDSSCDGM